MSGVDHPAIRGQASAARLPRIRAPGHSPPVPDPSPPYALLQAAAARVRALQPSTPIHERIQACRAAARGFAGEGAFGSAEAFLEQALPWARLLPAADEAVLLLCEMAEAAAASAEPVAGLPKPSAPQRLRARQRAVAHAAEAALLAPQVACPGWEVAVLLRVSALMQRCGRGDEAVALQARAARLRDACVDTTF